ncbi:hypothetical protein HPP92_000169 [Vanilla planifolia]|uniref:Pentatricopeptide repeat-containing protein n=1 Tax=Vanilla planifolia TaxID=51239 RepID=A0A835RRL2_VANPL|nr:hypothetical protein HPP92_000169 [Vanilla planifolia]
MSTGCLNEAKTLSRASLSLVLPECSEMSKNGLEIHAYAIRKGLESSTSVGNALMAMYSKMRNMESIHKVFQRILEKDIISWNTMVASYAAANKFDEAFELFRHMLTREFELDEYSFSSVLHGSGPFVSSTVVPKKLSFRSRDEVRRWDDVANVRAAMKDGEVKKCPGYSWVEIGK